MAAGLPEQRLAGQTVHQPAAKRVTFEEPAAPAHPFGHAVPGDAVGRRERSGPENARRHQLIHQAELEHLGGALALPGQDDIECGPHTDPAREPLAASGSGKNANLYLGKPDDRLG